MITSIQPPAGTSHLSTSVPAKASRVRALEVLGGDGRAGWLGEAVAPAGDGERQRHLVDLELRVGEQMPRVTFRKAAYVDVGPARARRLMPIEVAISSAAAGPAPALPGLLRHAEHRRTMSCRSTGITPPPGGGIGIVADRLLLKVAARGAARLLLEKIAAAMATGEAA